MGHVRQEYGENQNLKRLGLLSSLFFQNENLKSLAFAIAQSHISDFSREILTIHLRNSSIPTEINWLSPIPRAQMNLLFRQKKIPRGTLHSNVSVRSGEESLTRQLMLQDNTSLSPNKPLPYRRAFMENVRSFGILLSFASANVVMNLDKGKTHHGFVKQTPGSDITEM